MTLSTHVLDTALGMPASGVAVRLERDGQVLTSAVTDSDGRVRALQPATGAGLTPGSYRLVFSVGKYFAARNTESLYSDITVEFMVKPGAEHYHIPLLLSPFGYSTYRGS